MALHNSGIGVWRHDNSPYGLVVMSPSANLPRCVMPFWTHAHAFSLYDVIMPLYAVYSSHGTVCHVAIMGPTNRKLSIRFYLHIILPFQCALLPTVPSATIAWLFARLAKQDSSSSMELAKVIDKIVKITKPLFLYFTWFFEFFFQIIDQVLYLISRTKCVIHQPLYVTCVSCLISCSSFKPIEHTCIWKSIHR